MPQVRMNVVYKMYLQMDYWKFTIPPPPPLPIETGHLPLVLILFFFLFFFLRIQSLYNQTSTALLKVDPLVSNVF